MATAAIEVPVPVRIHTLDAYAYKYNGRVKDYMEQFYPGAAPQEPLPLFKCKVQIAPGCTIQGYAWGNNIFIDDNFVRTGVTNWNFWDRRPKEVEVSDDDSDEEHD